MIDLSHLILLVLISFVVVVFNIHADYQEIKFKRLYRKINHLKLAVLVKSPKSLSSILNLAKMLDEVELDYKIYLVKSKSTKNLAAKLRALGIKNIASVKSQNSTITRRLVRDFSKEDFLMVTKQAKNIDPVTLKQALIKKLASTDKQINVFVPSLQHKSLTKNIQDIRQKPEGINYLTKIKDLNLTASLPKQITKKPSLIAKFMLIIFLTVGVVISANLYILSYVFTLVWLSYFLKGYFIQKNYSTYSFKKRILHSFIYPISKLSNV